MRVFMVQGVCPPTHKRHLYAHEEYDLTPDAARRFIAIGIATPVVKRPGRVRVLLNECVAYGDGCLMAGHEYDLDAAEAARLVAKRVASPLMPTPVFGSKTP